MLNNIFKISYYPLIRAINSTQYILLSINNKTFLIIYYDIKNNLYKIPVGFFNQPNKNSTLYNYVCSSTGFHQSYYNGFSINTSNYNYTSIKLLNHRPIYFNRFRYLGKGFKLVFKKKKKLFNCIFGYSHIYWLKTQQIFIKKTKKYKYFFVTNQRDFWNFINILKKVKPINRYTLRGLRTYTHTWFKYKGRKSVATHI